MSAGARERTSSSSSYQPARSASISASNGWPCGLAGSTSAGAEFTRSMGLATYGSSDSGGSCLESSLMDLAPSVAGEFFGPDVVLVDARANEHRPQSLDHAGRAGQVVDGIADTIQVTRQHRTIDVAPLTVPRIRWVQARHRRNERQVGVLPGQFAELVQEGRVLRSTIGVKDHHRVRQTTVSDRLGEDAPKRRDADAAGEHHGRSIGVV